MLVSLRKSHPFHVTVKLPDIVFNIGTPQIDVYIFMYPILPRVIVLHAIPDANLASAALRG